MKTETKQDQLVCPICFRQAEDVLMLSYTVTSDDGNPPEVRAYECQCNRHGNTIVRMQVVQFYKGGRWHLHKWRAAMGSQAGAWDYLAELPKGVEVGTQNVEAKKTRSEEVKKSEGSSERVAARGETADYEKRKAMAQINDATAGVKAAMDRLLEIIGRTIGGDTR